MSSSSSSSSSSESSEGEGGSEGEGSSGEKTSGEESSGEEDSGEEDSSPSTPGRLAQRPLIILSSPASRASASMPRGTASEHLSPGPRSKLEVEEQQEAEGVEEAGPSR